MLTCRVIEHSELAERDFYVNQRTGESYWSMPPQVKFYIPPRLEDKLLMVFDYGDIEEFQQYFSLLDVDSSGDLSGKEIKLLLKALDLKVGSITAAVISIIAGLFLDWQFSAIEKHFFFRSDKWQKVQQIDPHGWFERQRIYRIRWILLDGKLA